MICEYDCMYSNVLCMIYVRNMKVGDPRNKDTQMGALVSKEHLAKVRGFIEVAQSENCTIHCGESVDDLDLPEALREVKDGL